MGKAEHEKGCTDVIFWHPSEFICFCKIYLLLTQKAEQREKGREGLKEDFKFPNLLPKWQ